MYFKNHLALNSDEAKQHILEMCYRKGLDKLRNQTKHNKMKKFKFEDIHSLKFLNYMFQFCTRGESCMYRRHIIVLNHKKLKTIPEEEFNRIINLMIDNDILSRYYQTDFYVINPFFYNLIMGDSYIFNYDLKVYFQSKSKKN